jgi:two-component system, cell cycle response regulator CtrA
MRRSAADPEPVLSFGDLVIKGQLKRAEVAGKPVPLTTREYQLLELLAGRQGSTITKVYICKLRKKLAEVSGGKDYIETVWGRGYMLRDLSPMAIAV